MMTAFPPPLFRTPTAVVLACFVLALLVRLAVLAAASDATTLESGDYALYRIGAEHVLSAGDFTNSLFLVRPPGFVLLVAALRTDPVAVLVANGVLGALTAALTAALAWMLMRSLHVSAAAGVIFALEPGVVRYTVFLGPEPLANLLLLAGILACLHACAPQTKLATALVVGTVGGLLLGLSTLTRPATQWIFLPLLAALIWHYRHHVRRIAVPAAAVVVGGLVLPMLWTHHNRVVFNHAVVSTVGPYTMLYYRAASLET